MGKKQKAVRPLMRIVKDDRLFFGYYIKLIESNRVPRAIETKIRAAMAGN
jgi:hypothetical protein